MAFRSASERVNRWRRETVYSSRRGLVTAASGFSPGSASRGVFCTDYWRAGVLVPVSRVAEGTIVTVIVFIHENVAEVLRELGGVSEGIHPSFLAAEEAAANDQATQPDR